MEVGCPVEEGTRKVDLPQTLRLECAGGFEWAYCLVLDLVTVVSFLPWLLPGTLGVHELAWLIVMSFRYLRMLFGFDHYLEMNCCHAGPLSKVGIVNGQALPWLMGPRYHNPGR